MSVVVRLARADEAELLPQIERSAAETFRGSAHAWIADDEVSPASFHRNLAETGHVWVAEVEGDLAGFLTGEAFEDALHIWEFAVSHDHQGQGLGRALIRSAVATAAERGLPAVTLTTFSNIAWNAPFYERLGFRKLDAHERPDRLSAILAKEAARGLTDRCAMRLTL